MILVSLCFFDTILIKIFHAQAIWTRFQMPIMSYPLVPPWLKQRQHATAKLQFLPKITRVFSSSLMLAFPHCKTIVGSSVTLKKKKLKYGSSQYIFFILWSLQSCFCIYIFLLFINRKMCLLQNGFSKFAAYCNIILMLSHSIPVGTCCSVFTWRIAPDEA